MNQVIFELEINVAKSQTKFRFICITWSIISQPMLAINQSQAPSLKYPKAQRHGQDMNKKTSAQTNAQADVKNCNLISGLMTTKPAGGKQ
jgi:hypothetical protein